MKYDETCGKHEGMLFHKRGVCDTHEIQKFQGIVCFRYIGQSDLHITYYGLPHVWYIPGGQWI